MSNKDNKISSGLRGIPMLSLGHQNFVAAERVVGIIEASSLPAKRLRESALSADRLVDATAGRRTKSVIITDSHYVFLSAHSSQILKERLLGKHDIHPSLAEMEIKDGEFAS